jgi:hypothetical protein
MNLTKPGQRGCGSSRTSGSAYLCCGRSPEGSPIEEFQEVIDYYKGFYWGGISNKAEKLALRFYESGKIEFPRVSNPSYFKSITEGHWV